MNQAQIHHYKLSFNVLLSIIVFATLTRIALLPFIGHPPNFSALDALALFSGVYFKRRGMAFILVLLSVWIGDLLLNKILIGHWLFFYEGCYWQYGSYLLMAYLGTILKNKMNPVTLLTASSISSILFFTISNFGVWVGGLLYPFTFDGLISCYVAAIPFFKNTLLSDLFFNFLLFGGYQLLQNRFPKLRLTRALEKKSPSF